MDVEISYKTYLQLETLLSIQKLTSSEQDEMLFVITHQAYELWFKQLIHELDYLKLSFKEGYICQIINTLKRSISIIGLLDVQIEILGTMLPFSFAQFRDRIVPASGFQSNQFRELEFILGIKKSNLLNALSKDSSEWQTLNKRYHEKSVWEEFILFCKKKLPSDYMKDPSMTEEENLLLSLYKKPSLYTGIAEFLLDIDRGLQEWRYRHLKIVERIIGDEVMGTGSTSGFSYLNTTLFKSFCPELWKIRNKITSLTKAPEKIASQSEITENLIE